MAYFVSSLYFMKLYELVFYPISVGLKEIVAALKSSLTRDFGWFQTRTKVEIGPKEKINGHNKTKITPVA